jgi:uncharacterized protein (TIGR00725 family)
MADIRTNLISVIGGASADHEEISWAEKFGKLLADNGFTVICGGGTGIMEAVCRGVAFKGGHSIGILPGSDPQKANRWVETVIVTGMGTSRNRIIALSGRVVAAVGGMYGTLSEIAYALQAGKPVCAMGKWAGIDGVVPVSSPEEALDFIIENTGGNLC